MVGNCSIVDPGLNFASMRERAACTYSSMGRTKEASAAPAAKPTITTIRTIKPLRTLGFGLDPSDSGTTFGADASIGFEIEEKGDSCVRVSGGIGIAAVYGSLIAGAGIVSSGAAIGIGGDAGDFIAEIASEKSETGVLGACTAGPSASDENGESSKGVFAVIPAPGTEAGPDERANGAPSGDDMPIGSENPHPVAGTSGKRGVFPSLSEELPVEKPWPGMAKDRFSSVASPPKSIFETGEL